ncbi:MAG TPA: H(+)/Cl(-) exchange transporter ClcA [Anaerolineales bacterium]|nr:H(+)/Cl(-) exchange transporter ClcA [Anaerolineales bacterium]
MSNNDDDRLPEEATATTTSPAAAISEIQEYIEISEQRRRVFPRAALVGLGAGLIAAVFRTTLAGMDALRNSLIARAHDFPAWAWILPVLFSAAGATASVVLVRRFAPETAGSGVPHLKAVLHRFRTLTWKRVLPVKFLAGASAIGGGLALGREGPTVQMGGAIGDAIAGWLKGSPRERRTLIAAGAGAGLAAAFNAPLSGLIFVLEEVRRDFHPMVFGAAFIAAVVADIPSRLISGAFPVFTVPNYPTPPLSSLPGFAVLGIGAGLLGIAFNKSLLGTLDLFARLRGSWAIAIPAGVGGLVGLVAWFNPLLVGSGHSLAEQVLAGKLMLSALPVLFVMRFGLTTSSYGTGASGGIFAPLLVLGALLGLTMGQILQAIAPAWVPQPAVFAVVGMAAYFAAIVRAPLTGIMLIVEMTGSYQQMLPLLVSCFFAYAVAELLKDLPIYEALLERDLVQDGLAIHLREPVVADFEVHQGAAFEGMEVWQLGLPQGCVLVRCVEAGREQIPTAHTRLEAHMRITAVVAPEAEEAIRILREGCKAPSTEKQ